MQEITIESVKVFIASNNIPFMATQSKRRNLNYVSLSFLECVKKCYMVLNLMTSKYVTI